LHHALLPKSPPLWRCLRIVHTDTFCKILQLAVTSLALRKGYFFEMRQICLLSLKMVFNGLPLFGKSDTNFVFRNLIQTLRMVLYAILMSVLFCRKDAPWYLFIIINFLTESVIFPIYKIISQYNSFETNIFKILDHFHIAIYMKRHLKIKIKFKMNVNNK